MTRFRSDNTEGYDERELAELNTAWARLIADAATCDSPPLNADDLGDYWSAELLHAYDSGKRGSDLLGWFYTTGGL
jgi:hypothetical protein